MKRREIIPLEPGEFRYDVSTCNVLERVEALPSGKRVLLPAYCEGGAVLYSIDMLRVVLKDDSCSVLITGETGTGKEALFQCIKERSSRKGGVREINCAGLTSESLVESELFGHVKGAYTGAERDRGGLVKMCENGILFLDEIGWLPKPVQAKLLRFMETGKYFPVGSDHEVSAKNVRIVAATNQNVTEVLLHDFVFRFDHHIGLPPLRERGADILWFLGEKGFLGGQPVYTGISLRTLLVVLCNQWDGNVRELAKYCQCKVMFRCCETGEPNEDEHILDDDVFVQPDKSLPWMPIAEAALAGAECEETTDRLLAGVPERSRLLGVFDDIMHWRGRNMCISDPNYYSPGIVFPIAGLTEQLFGSSGHWLTGSVPCWLRADWIPSEEDVTADITAQDSDCLAEMLVMLRRIVYMMYPRVTGTDWSVRKPSEEWLKDLRTRSEACGLQGTITPPDLTFEELMTEAGLGDELKECCRHCKSGMSGGKIGKVLGMSKSKVNVKLAKVRREHPGIAGHLPGGKAGRPSK